MWRNRSKTLGRCAWCEAPKVSVESHHLYRRSIRPDLKNDPKNKIKLCEWCHRVVSVSRPLEVAMQRQFYPNPPKFRAQNDIDLNKPMNNKAKDILLAQVRKLRFQASNKERDAARLRKQADELEASAKKLANVA